MRENGFQAPTDPARCGFQLGQRTSLSAFAWLLQRPEHQGHFIRWMTGRMAGLALWLDGFDFPGVVLGAGKQGAAGAAAETDADTVLFVDVGGALGHNAILLRQRYPDLKGRVVVQDQASVVEQSRAAALPGHEDVERQVYDFWTPQPIKGEPRRPPPPPAFSYLYAPSF